MCKNDLSQRKTNREHNILRLTAVRRPLLFISGASVSQQPLQLMGAHIIVVVFERECETKRGNFYSCTRQEKLIDKIVFAYHFGIDLRTQTHLINSPFY